jgi:hypothetical protein
MSPPSSGLNGKPSNQHVVGSKQGLPHVGFFLCLLFNPEDWGDIFTETSFDFQWTLSEKTKLFKTTAVGTSNHTILFYLLSFTWWSRDRSAGIAMGYRLDCRGSIPGKAWDFILHSIQTSCMAHPAFYPMGTRGYFHGGKAAGTWSWPLTSI